MLLLLFVAFIGVVAAATSEEGLLHPRTENISHYGIKGDVCAQGFKGKPKELGQ